MAKVAQLTGGTKQMYFGISRPLFERNHVNTKSAQSTATLLPRRHRNVSDDARWLRASAEGQNIRNGDEPHTVQPVPKAQKVLQNGGERQTRQLTRSAQPTRTAETTGPSNRRTRQSSGSTPHRPQPIGQTFGDRKRSCRQPGYAR